MPYRFAYFIFAEGLSAVVRRQVIDIIPKIAKGSNSRKYIIIWFFPWNFFLKKHSVVNNLKDELRQHGIRLIAIPLPYPIIKVSVKNGLTLKHSYSPYAVLCLTAYALPVLLFLKLRFGITVFHCRSYLSTLSASVLKLICRDQRIIFDPRSDFPEEMAFVNGWSKYNFKYKFLKRVESFNVRKANYIIPISDTFDNEIKKLGPRLGTRVIYNNVDITRFWHDDNFRDNYRKENNLEEKTIICYSGTLYANTWNRPDLYARFMQLVLSEKTIREDLFFMILTQANCVAETIQSLKRYNIDEKYFEIISPHAGDVPKLLSVADWGMYFLPYYSPRMGTKFAEYSAVGIPTIVNRNVGGASDLIDRYQLGIVVDIDTPSKNFGEKLKICFQNDLAFRERSKLFARNHFANEIAINSYLHVYREILT